MKRGSDYGKRLKRMLKIYMKKNVKIEVKDIIRHMKKVLRAPKQQKTTCEEMKMKVKVIISIHED
jgi:hypothetical protein